MFKNSKFLPKLSRIIIDEAHCIDLWGSTFRPPYKDLARLNVLLSTRAPRVQWYLTSATLNLNSISNILRILEMAPVILKSPTPPNATHLIQRSNDRPNLHYAVRQMKFSASSFQDLSILVPEGLLAADPRPPGFIVYVNSRLDAQRAAKYLRSHMAKDMADTIVYVHAGMSELHRNEAVLGFTQGIIIAIIATEALGLVCQSCLHLRNNTHILTGYGPSECDYGSTVWDVRCNSHPHSAIWSCGS